MLADSALASRDFGGVVEAAPAAVAEVRTPEDVAQVFEIARERAVPVNVRGSGHSCGGQSLLEGGIVLLNRVDGSPSWIGEHEIETPAGLTWEAVETALRSRQRSVRGMQ